MNHTKADHTKVFVQRVVSADGKTIAEARSEVTTSDSSEGTSYQSVRVNASSNHSSSSSSSSSATTNPT